MQGIPIKSVSLSDCTVDSLRVTNAHQDAGDTTRPEAWRGNRREASTLWPTQHKLNSLGHQGIWLSSVLANITRTVVSRQCEWEKCCYSEEAVLLALVQFSLLLFSQSREISITNWNLKRQQSSLPSESLGDEAELRFCFGVRSDIFYISVVLQQYCPCWKPTTQVNGQSPHVKSLDQQDNAPISEFWQAFENV